MKQSGLSAFPFLKPSVQGKSQPHAAVLMNPHEVDLAFRVDMVDARHFVLGHWLLTGAVNRELFAKLRANVGKNTSAGVEILSTPCDANYAIFCSQLGPFQHRHVLPLYEPKVADFMESAAREQFRVFIECSGSNGERMLYRSPLPPRDFYWAHSMCQTTEVEQRREFIWELPALIEQVTTLDIMPSMNGEPVREVDVSILLPPEAIENTIFDGGCFQERSHYRH